MARTRQLCYRITVFLADYEKTRSPRYQRCYRLAYKYWDRAEYLSHKVLNGLRAWSFIIPDANETQRLSELSYIYHAANRLVSGSFRLVWYDARLRLDGRIYLNKARTGVASLYLLPQKMHQECLDLNKKRLSVLAEDIRIEQEANISMSEFKSRHLILENSLRDLVSLFARPRVASIRQLDQGACHLDNLTFRLESVEQEVAKRKKDRANLDKYRAVVRDRLTHLETAIKDKQLGANEQMQAIISHARHLVDRQAETARHHADFDLAKNHLEIAEYQIELGQFALPHMAIAADLLHAKLFSLRPQKVEAVLATFDELLRTIPQLQTKGTGFSAKLQAAIGEITSQKSRHEQDIQKLEEELQTRLSEMDQDWRKFQEIAALKQDPLNLRRIDLHEQAKDACGKPTVLQAFNHQVQALSNDMNAAFPAFQKVFSTVREQYKQLEVKTEKAVSWGSDWQCLATSAHQLNTKFQDAHRHWLYIRQSTTLEEADHTFNQISAIFQTAHSLFSTLKRDHDYLESHFNMANQKLRQAQKMAEQVALHADEWVVLRHDNLRLQQLVREKELSLHTIKRHSSQERIIRELEKIEDNQATIEQFEKIDINIKWLDDHYQPMVQLCQRLTSKLDSEGKNIKIWTCLLANIDSLEQKVNQLASRLENARQLEDFNDLQSTWSKLTHLENSCRRFETELDKQIAKVQDLERQARLLSNQLNRKYAEATELPDNWVYLKDFKDSVSETYLIYGNILDNMQRKATIFKVQQLVRRFQDALDDLNEQYGMIVEGFSEIRRQTITLEKVIWPKLDELFKKGSQAYSKWAWRKEEAEHISEILKTAHKELAQVRNLRLAREVQATVERIASNLSYAKTKIEELDRHCYSLDGDVASIKHRMTEIRQVYSHHIPSPVKVCLGRIEANLADAPKQTEFIDVARLIQDAKNDISNLATQVPSTNISITGANFGPYGTVNQNYLNRPRRK